MHLRFVKKIYEEMNEVNKVCFPFPSTPRAQTSDQPQYASKIRSVPILPRFPHNLRPKLPKIVITFSRQPSNQCNILIAPNPNPARQLQRGTSLDRPPSLDPHNLVRTLVDEVLISLVSYADILVTQPDRLGAQPPVSEAEQRQAIEVLRVNEEHHQHAAFRLDGTFDCEGEPFIARVDIRVRIGDVEGGGDQVADTETTACKAGEFAVFARKGHA